MTIVGAYLRLRSLGVHSLWIDEAASVQFATMPWRPFLHTLWSYQGNMTLYYLLLRLWIHLGDSEFMVRSLSVLFSVLTIPVMYALGKRLFDRPTGLVAAALLSVHSFHIIWSQQARAYGLLLLLLVLATYYLRCAIESDQSRALWLAFTVCAALSVYAHIFAVLALAAHAVAIIFPRPYRMAGRTLLMVAILFEHLIAPMALFVVLRHSNQINWIPRPSLAEFYGFLQLLTSQGGVVLIVGYLMLCVLAWLPLGGAEPEPAKWALRLLTLWLLLPPLLTLAVSPIKPLFDPGFMVICVPAIVMLAARGLIRMGQVPLLKYWAAAVFLLVVSLSAASVAKPTKYRITLNADWRSAVNYVLERQLPGDGAFFYTPNDYPYLYYARRAAQGGQRVATAPDVLYPTEPWEPLSREEVDKVTAGRQRVWLILHNESANPQDSSLVESTLGERRAVLDERVFSGDGIPVTVKLYGAMKVATPHSDQ